MENIIIGGLWYGPGKPDFQLFQLEFVQKIKNFMNTGFEVVINNQVMHFLLNVEAELADLPAKAASVCMKQFNGRFGCPHCYHPGCKLRPDKLVWIYPYQTENNELRTHEEFLLHAELAEDNQQIVYGVKARSVYFRVPIELPTDWMHLALEGELKRKLRYILDERNEVLDLETLEFINQRLPSIKYPHNYHHKVRHISNVSCNKAKAGELQTLLLHVLLPLMKDNMEPVYFCHLGLLVTSMQLLNKDKADLEDVRNADIMIDVSTL